MELLKNLQKILTEGTYVSILYQGGRGFRGYCQGQVEEQYLDEAGEMVIEMDQGFVYINTETIERVTYMECEDQEYTIEFCGDTRMEIHVL